MVPGAGVLGVGATDVLAGGSDDGDGMMADVTTMEGVVMVEFAAPGSDVTDIWVVLRVASLMTSLELNREELSTIKEGVSSKALDVVVDVGDIVDAENTKDSFISSDETRIVDIHKDSG